MGFWALLFGDKPAAAPENSEPVEDKAEVEVVEENESSVSADPAPENEPSPVPEIEATPKPESTPEFSSVPVYEPVDEGVEDSGSTEEEDSRLVEALIADTAEPAGHKNDEVRSTLVLDGEDGGSELLVVHTAYKGNDKATEQDEVASYLESLGFDVIDASEDGVIRMQHTREVSSSEFDAFTDELEIELANRGWDYGGWEADSAE
jgi:hypothetical protein